MKFYVLITLLFFNIFYILPYAGGPVTGTPSSPVQNLQYYFKNNSTKDVYIYIKKFNKTNNNTLQVIANLEKIAPKESKTYSVGIDNNFMKTYDIWTSVNFKLTKKAEIPLVCPKNVKTYPVEIKSNAPFHTPFSSWKFPLSNNVQQYDVSQWMYNIGYNFCIPSKGENCTNAINFCGCWEKSQNCGCTTPNCNCNETGC